MIILAGEQLGTAQAAAEDAIEYRSGPLADVADGELAVKYGELRTLLLGAPREGLNVAAALRRHAIDAARSKLEARTQRDAREAVGKMFAFVSALRLLIRAGLAEPGIDTPVGAYENPNAVAELVRFLGGEQHARELGLTWE